MILGQSCVVQLLLLPDSAGAIWYFRNFCNVNAGLKFPCFKNLAEEICIILVAVKANVVLQGAELQKQGGAVKEMQWDMSAIQNDVQLLVVTVAQIIHSQAQVGGGLGPRVIHAAVMLP